MKIIDLQKYNTQMVMQSAKILVKAFKGGSWTNVDEGLVEVNKGLQAGNMLLCAIDDGETVLGWIGGIPIYDGRVWELHPLAVDPKYQGKGVGSALVNAFEKRVKELGAITILLGADDEANMTSLANVNLYEDIGEKIATIKNHRRHPFEFYQKLGFTIVGVIPDANGIGKPDILMAKKVR